MVAFLPSEVARLVLGYLETQNCEAAYHEFLNGCKHLEECRGREFFTTIMGMSLDDILEDYCAIHSYVMQFKCSTEVKKKLSKCLNLLQKISILIESSALPNDNYKHKSFSNSIYSTEVQTANSCQRTSVNSDSSDDLSTFKNKKYGKTPVFERTSGYKKSNNLQNIDECAIRSTNLYDLPGHKNDFSGKGNVWKYKDRENESQYSQDVSIKVDNDKKNSSKTYFSKDIAHHSIDQINPSLKVITPESREMDFRYALGLVKNETPDFDKFTPAKRKSMKPKLSTASLKKSSHLQENFTNESLDVTTITNALLDCKEMHEQIAKNINQMIHPSSKLDMDENSSNADNAVTSYKEVGKTNDPLLLDEDTQQLEGVIRAIVEKTEKDPIFDQFLNEVLVASVESNTGSDSDLLSRPETSTPEKSCRSGSYACSPTSSCHSFEPIELQNKKLNRINNYPWKSLNQDSKTNSNQEVGKGASKIDSSNLKKYPSRPRGGKRMEILRQNYADYEFDQCNDSTQSSPSENSMKIPEQSKQQSSKLDQKVVILSNEPVKSNIQAVLNKEYSTEIKNNDFDKPNLEIVDNSLGNQGKDAQLRIRRAGNMKKIIVNSKISKGEVNPIESCQATQEKENDNKNKNDIETINAESTDVTKLKISAGIIGTSNKLIENEIYQTNMPQYISGKPPELIISNKTILLQSTPEVSGTKVYTEAEIMKMPTIIVIKPIEQPLEASVSNTQQWNTKFDNNKDFSLAEKPVQNIKTLSKRELIPILPKINNSNDILSLIEGEKYQVNNFNISDIVTKPLIQPLPLINEISSNFKVVDEIVTDNNLNTNDKILASSFKDDMNIDFKTTTPDKDTFKKLCSSTPTRKYTHVRVLDFNTPTKNISKRKSLTSPKKVLSINKRQKKSKVKSCLFAPVNEENVEDPLVDVNGGSNSQPENICNEREIDANKNSIKQNISKPEVSGCKNVSIKENTEIIKVKKVAKFNWDRDLRAMAICNPLPDKIHVKEKKKRRKIVNKKAIKLSADLTNSFEKEGRLLEQALLEKSFNSCSPLVKKTSLNTSIKNSNDCKVNLLEQNCEDLQLSMTSNSEDTLNQSKISSSKGNLNKSKSTSKEYILPTRGSGEDKTSVKRKVNQKKKVAKGKSSTFKVKIGSKVYSDTSKKHAAEDTNKLEKRKSSLKKIEQKEAIISKELNNSSLNNKEAEIHVTPEFPREFRSQPIDVKFNLSSFLETPYKTNLLDMSIATPKFLSPDLLSEPISAIKMLGIPTPNFDTPFLQSNGLFSGPNFTPDSHASRKTDYSSGGSYYKPDEVDVPLLDLPSNPSDIDPSVEKNKNKKSKSKESKNKTEKLNVEQNDKIAKKSQSPISVAQKDSDSKSNILNSSPNNNSKMVLRSRLSRNRWSRLSSPLKKNTKSPRVDKSNLKTTSPLKTNKSIEIVDRFKKMSGSETELSPNLPHVNNGEKENKLCASKENKMKKKEKESLEEKRLRIISKLNSEKKPPIKKTKKIGLLNKDVHKIMANKKPISKNDSPKTIMKNLPLLLNEGVASKKNLNENEIKKLNYIPLSKSRRKSSTPRKLEKAYEPLPSQLVNDSSKDNLSKVITEYKNVSNESVNLTLQTCPQQEANSETDIKPLKTVNVAKSYGDVTRVATEKSNFQLNLEKEGFSSEVAKEIEDNLTDESNQGHEFCKDIVLDKNEIMVYDNEPNLPAQISFTSKVDAVAETIIVTHFEKENSEILVDCTEKKDDDIILSNDIEKSELNNELANSDNEEDVVIIWCNSECNKSSSNYLFAKHDSENKNRKKINNQSTSEVELNSFILNANIYNTMKNIEETRVIKPNEFETLLDMSPNSKLRTKISTISSKLSDKKILKSNTSKKVSPLEILMNEMDKSLSSDVVSTTKQQDCITNLRKTEEKKIINTLDTSQKCSTIDFARKIEVDDSKEKFQKSIGNIVKAPVEITFDDNVILIEDKEADDLMDMAISSTTVDKRKRTDEVVSDVGTKKHKTVIPQQLLKEIDIEEILSQLHPG